MPMTSIVYDMWNIYDRTFNSQNWMNNHAAAVHQCLQSVLQMDNLSIWKIINRPWLEQTCSASRWLPAMLPPNVGNIASRICESLTLVRDYSNRPMIEYLSSNICSKEFLYTWSSLPFHLEIVCDAMMIKYLHGITHNLELNRQTRPSINELFGTDV